MRPHQYLQPYIDRYWLWEDENCFPKILPGTGTELMFHFHKPFAVNSGNYYAEMPTCHIVSPRYITYDVKPIGRIGFIAVRFRAGAFRKFCKEPMNEIIDSFIEIQEIWGRQGGTFGNQVIEAKSLENRISIIETFLMKCLHNFEKQEKWLDYAVNKIYYDYNVLQLNSISDELAISNRQIQRKIKEYVGVSPKVFQRIARLESVMKYLLLNKKKDYLDIALDRGYYDQSHFIKECNNFLGASPSIFLQEKNFMSHFYNEKLYP